MMEFMEVDDHELNHDSIEEMTSDTDTDLSLAMHFQNILLYVVSSQIILVEGRIVSIFDQRLLWTDFLSRFSISMDFYHITRMHASSFSKIVEMIRDELEVDFSMAALQGGAILPELCLYLTLRYLAGGTYLDIKLCIGISTGSFYRCLW
jgi:hypothetical protein